jgi:hypothetical protein
MRLPYLDRAGSLRPRLHGDRLAIYLNDHLAGATGVLELARRLSAQNSANGYSEELRHLSAEIEHDRKVLVEVMERLSVAPDPLKLGASWVAEKLGRLKLNGALVRYSPLSRLEELELLSLGIQGKLALWEVLRATRREDPGLRSIDLDDLIARARGQRRTAERLRKRAAQEALA